MAEFAKTKAGVDASEKKTLGEGLFRKCDACGDAVRKDDFERNLEVCPACGFHFHLTAEQWIALLADDGSWTALDTELSARDPLEFIDSKAYPDRVEAARTSTGVNDAILAGTARIDGRAVQLGVFVFRFMGGSMGSVVGEVVTRMMERGAEHEQPVVLLSCSGGARMQEGSLSLMQMAKTVAARGKLRDAGAPFISVLLNPTTGGVAASFALQGDVNIAEPRALIGFAGPRVIEDTIRQKLPEGFQRAEFLLEHGMIDMISTRQDMRANISRLVEYLSG
ncbi:MAG: acetyl-CoA carboxylase carboxyltransferase subunit beta [Myxococcales bacterium]|nr:acetyl-CoA carboxylase carboxyltransferase subunit beta [Deltaproteobacteria bacterium]MBW2548726.1 acetyl-CoA carboxylase carboxyltransferase subunit beta [Deltaproteobacteria bacterium]NOQ84683.1 acetyl-CoA carboxylase carboxyltransferase subunit beta [Myxococcales bacterium]